MEYLGRLDLVYDRKWNHSLYISSSKNNKIFVYDSDDQSLKTLNPTSGDGILRFPQGLMVIRDDLLYVANSANNEVLTYSLTAQSLDVFTSDFSEQLRPGAIAFGPENDLYMIDELDNSIYRYNANNGELMGLFRYL